MQQAPQPGGLPQGMDEAAVIALGAAAFAQEAAAVAAVGRGLDGRFFQAVRALLECRGMVLMTGLGKSGFVARKLAATLTGTGTPSLFIHPVEAAHGDLGIVRDADVLVAISRSGSNPEVVQLAARCRRFGMTCIAITGGTESELAKTSDVLLPVPVAAESCPLNLTPTTSALAAMAMGDALTVALIRLRGFRPEDFALFHPSGVLGRGLLVKVSELMHTGRELPVVGCGLTLRESLPEIVGKRLGGTCVVDEQGRLAGVCVDGDVKRVLLARRNALDLPITEVMNPDPTVIGPDLPAAAALGIMEKRKEGPVTLLIVTDEQRRPLGLLHIHDILRAGIL